MKNLQDLNLVELNAQEVKSVEGGFLLAVLGLYEAWAVVGGVFVLGAYNGYHATGK